MYTFPKIYIPFYLCKKILTAFSYNKLNIHHKLQPNSLLDSPILGRPKLWKLLLLDPFGLWSPKFSTFSGSDSIVVRRNFLSRRPSIIKSERSELLDQNHKVEASKLHRYFETCRLALKQSIYKLGYVKRGSTAFKVQKGGCGIPSAARALLGPEGLLMQ